MIALLSPTLWKIVGFLAVLLAVGGGSFYGGYHHEQVAFQDFKDQQVAAAATQVASNQTAVAAISASQAEWLQQVAASRLEQVNEIQTRNEALVAANNDVAGKLRTYLARPSRKPVVVSQAAAGPGGSDAASAAALPDGLQQFTQWLTYKFYQADVDAVNLTEAQEIIKEDRLICNGSLPGITAASAPQ